MIWEIFRKNVDFEIPLIRGPRVNKAVRRTSERSGDTSKQQIWQHSGHIKTTNMAAE